MLCESDNYTKDIAAPIGSNGLPQIWDDSEEMYFATGPISTTFTDDMPLLDRVNMKRPKTEYYAQEDDGTVSHDSDANTAPERQAQRRRTEYDEDEAEAEHEPRIDRFMKRPKTEYYVQQDDVPTDVDEEEWDFNKCMWVKYGCASALEETEDAEDPRSDDDVEDGPEVEKNSETDSDDNEGSGVESGETESDEE